MKKFLLVVIVSVCLLGGTVQAHVLIADSQRRMGAVLHITPDDDPIAGEPSTISLSIQGANISEKTHAFRLHIKSDQGREGDVPLHITSGTVTASYVFPMRGVYALVLTAEPISGEGQTITFEHAQRVSRGEAGSGGVMSPLWARMGLVGSVSALFVIGFMVFNKRKVLSAYAEDRKFK